MGKHAKRLNPVDEIIEEISNKPGKSKGKTIPSHAVSRRKRHPVLYGLTLFIFTVFTFTLSAGGIMYLTLQNNITSSNVDALLGDNRPTREPVPEEDEPRTGMIDPLDPFAHRDINILVMGSDVRDEDNEGYGDVEGMRSDTTLLVHVSKDRSRVDAVSIPRDSWVPIPECERADGSWTRPMTTKFNAAFAYGGATGDTGSAAACTIKTVEELTGVYVDAFTVVDFSGFERIVDSLGGVDMCVPELIDAPLANHLYLEPGVHTMDGETALSFARARSGAGLTGSDIARIDRQQELFNAIADKALNSLTDLPTLYSFLESATSTLTVSSNISSLSRMAGLTWSLRSLEDLEFHTVPVVDRGDGANVLWTSEADLLWEQMRNDSFAPENETTEANEEEAPRSSETEDAESTTKEETEEEDETQEATGPC